MCVCVKTRNATFLKGGRGVCVCVCSVLLISEVIRGAIFMKSDAIAKGSCVLCILLRAGRRGVKMLVEINKGEGRLGGLREKVLSFCLVTRGRWKAERNMEKKGKIEKSGGRHHQHGRRKRRRRDRVEE